MALLCTDCGTLAAEGARYCAQCGRLLGIQARPVAGPSTAAPAAATAENRASAAGDSDPSADVELFETAIGPNRTDYYLVRFRRFASGQGLASWNWPAFFVPLLWFLYRKMWGYAAMYFFLLPIAMGIVLVVLFLVLPEGVATGLGWAIQLGVVLVALPMYANALYYRAVQDRIRAAQARSSDRELQLRALARAGGTSAAAFIVLLVLFVPVVGILAAIAIPAYQDYTIRAQVSEGLNLAAPAKAAIADAFVRSGTMPAGRAEAGLTSDGADSAGKYVSAIDIEDGRIDISYGGAASSLLAGKSLSITPYGVRGRGDTWSIVWRCGLGPVPPEATHEVAQYQPGNIEPKYLPSACRP